MSLYIYVTKQANKLLALKYFIKSVGRFIGKDLQNLRYLYDLSFQKPLSYVFIIMWS